MSDTTPDSPESPLVGDQPNYELLHLTGWSVGTVVGRYCVAWRGADEVVLTWNGGEWRQVAGRGALRRAA
ncbi:MAG TPA: hypothetical protein VM533_05830 [Fimbriiglobus sp.]|jgi:hypothetical protein|nr:hypothetical protein [Fimbriiglobus sp.]